ncbi:MAG: hypothetical protein V8S24_11645 [Gordonibacter pamelaeae]
MKWLFNLSFLSRCKAEEEFLCWINTPQALHGKTVALLMNMVIGFGHLTTVKPGAQRAQATITAFYTSDDGVSRQDLRFNPFVINSAECKMMMATRITNFCTPQSVVASSRQLADTGSVRAIANICQLQLKDLGIYVVIKIHSCSRHFVQARLTSNTCVRARSNTR